MLQKIAFTIFVLVTSLFAEVSTNEVMKTAGQFKWGETGVVAIDKRIWQDQQVNLEDNYNWAKANQYCESLILKVGDRVVDDFRLPSSDEFIKVYDKQNLFKFIKNYYDLQRYNGICSYWTSGELQYQSREYFDFFKDKTFTWEKDKFNLSKRIGTKDNGYNYLVKCISNSTYYDTFHLDILATEIANERVNKISNLQLPLEPVKKEYEIAPELTKDEFESTADFQKRVDAQSLAIKKANELVDTVNTFRMNTWKEEVKKAELVHQNALSTLESKKAAFYLSAISEAFPMKYGSPKIKDVEYDADTQRFKIRIISQNFYYDNKFLNKNLLSDFLFFKSITLKKVYHKDGDITVFSFSANRDMMWDSINERNLEKTGKFLYIEKNGFKRNRHDNVNAGDILDVFMKHIPESEFSLPDFIGDHFDDTKVIKLNNFKIEKYFGYDDTVEIPVAIEYAPKFKELLSNPAFSPIVEMEYKEGTFKIVGIEQIKNPERLVLNTEYEKAKNSIDALKTFISKYPKNTFTPKAQSRLEELEFKNAKSSVDSLEGFIKTYPSSTLIVQAKKEIANIKQEKVKQEALKKDREKQLAAERAKEQKLYNLPKNIGDKVCTKVSTYAIFSIDTYTISGYVEGKSGNRIQIRIADPRLINSYQGVQIYKGAIIWDQYDNWKQCY